MRRPWNGAMPVMWTWPARIEHHRRARRRRARRLAIGALIVLAVLLAAGVWLPHADARLTSTAGEEPLPPLATLQVGDVLRLEGPDGSLLAYTIEALDVVDVERAELRLDAADRMLVLAMPWPLDTAEVGGNWRYVVTARQRLAEAVDARHAVDRHDRLAR